MKNFIKGFFAGIFSITPGLSGSILLIILNLYDKCIYEISNIFKTPKKSIIFLLPIALGVVLGIYSFSNIIFILIKNYKEEAFIIFTGFIFASIPNIIKKSTRHGFKKSYLLSFFIALFVGISMLHLRSSSIKYNIDYNLFSLIKYTLIGFILSISTIIPGISSTILLSLFNFYGIYIISISSFNLYVLIPVTLGFIVTTIIISKIINYLLTNYYGYTYFFILGFSISTIPTLLSFKISFTFNTIISIILAIVFFFITYISIEKATKNVANL